MEKNLTINYTYYNNLDILSTIVKHYGDCNLCNFQIIDDGSKPPLSPSQVPAHWHVYRIHEDIGWNNEGARNILMETTTTEWNVLVDMDYVIDVENIKKLVDFIPFLDKNKAYRFALSERMNPRPINSFLISKKLFNYHGGYDRAFLGWYGNDITLLSKIHEGCVPEKLQTVVLRRITQQVVDVNKTSLKDEFTNYLNGLKQQGLITIKWIPSGGISSVDWNDDEIHQKYYKHLTWSRVQ